MIILEIYHKLGLKPTNYYFEIHALKGVAIEKYT